MQSPDQQPRMTSVAETLMLAFEGRVAPGGLLDRIRRDPPAGVSLFRADNVDDAAQVRALTESVQDANPADLPLLVATDQEGGQFLALAGLTEFAGNMALGAAGDTELTERVGRAVGTELRAVGVNVDYAPIGDVATNPANPALGIRSFGDDPHAVAGHVAAFVRGLSSAGVVATLKHFPGKGGATVDSHFGLPVIANDRDRLEEVELVPFRAGIGAGAGIVMTGHFAVPGLTESDDLPSTLSPAIMQRLLRDELGFSGVAITDALDMGAIAQGAGQVIDAIAAIAAGVDLLLLKGEGQDRVEQGLTLAVRRGLIGADRLAAARARTRAIRGSVADAAIPDLEVVGSTAHRALARELAERSITLIRNDVGLIPIRPEVGARIAAIMPEPRDLTPADTSSLVAPGLASALRRHHGGVDAFVVGHPPPDDEIAALRAKVADYDLVVLGTLSASFDRQQAALAAALLNTDVPVVTVALRTPYDLTAYPQSVTHLASYGILSPTMEALAATIFGKVPFTGRLPVAIDADYPRGHGVVDTGGSL